MRNFFNVRTERKRANSYKQSNIMYKTEAQKSILLVCSWNCFKRNWVFQATFIFVH